MNNKVNWNHNVSYPPGWTFSLGDWPGLPHRAQCCLGNPVHCWWRLSFCRCQFPHLHEASSLQWTYPRVQCSSGQCRANRLRVSLFLSPINERCIQIMIHSFQWDIQDHITCSGMTFCVVREILLGKWGYHAAVFLSRWNECTIGGQFILLLNGIFE